MAAVNCNAAGVYPDPAATSTVKLHAATQAIISTESVLSQCWTAFSLKCSLVQRLIMIKCYADETCAIQAWSDTHDTSPTTGRPMSSTAFVPHTSLQTRIRSLLEAEATELTQQVGFNTIVDLDVCELRIIPSRRSNGHRLEENEGVGCNMLQMEVTLLNMVFETSWIAVRQR